MDSIPKNRATITRNISVDMIGILELGSFIDLKQNHSKRKGLFITCLKL